MEQTPARIFGSLAVAMVTPFFDDGTVDYESAKKVATKLVDDGCDCVLVSGTTGESPTTHQEEKAELIRVVKASVGQRAFIMAGAGSNDTAHAVRMAQGAAEAGADGLLVVSPYYNRPSQEGLYQHVRSVVESTDLPVMLYDIPGRTGLAFGDDTLDRLAELETVLAVKDATGDVARGLDRMKRTGLEYYSGDDGLNFAWQLHGASGYVSVAGHVCAKQYRQMIELIDSGQIAAARELSYSLIPLVEALMGTGQGAVMAKQALYLQGVIASAQVRLPLVSASAPEIAVLEQALDSFGLR